jgi:hypothetical protein
MMKRNGLASPSVIMITTNRLSRCTTIKRAQAEVVELSLRTLCQGSRIRLFFRLVLVGTAYYICVRVLYDPLTANFVAM